MKKYRTLFFLLFCLLSLASFSQELAPMSVPPPGGGGCTPPSNPGNPTASTNTCGNKTLTRSGTPPTGVRWYWQTSSGGTSLDYGGSTFTATQSGTYYIRAYKYACDMWGSGGGYINVTVNNPGAPSTPTVTDYCSSVVLTRGAPPSGVTWYWQDMSSSGTSTANSAATYTAYSSGTYYIRSYHNATGCWGASNSVSVTLTQGPTAPPTPLASGGCGQANLSWNGSPAQFIRWCWQTSPGGTDMSTMGSAYTVYSSGTYYLRAYDLNTQCWSPASQISVTVYPLPNAAASDQTICSGQTTSVPIANPNGISGTTFSWTVSQTNTSGAAAGSGSTISQALYATTASTGYATYTITPRANGCNGSPITVTVNVKPTPTAAASDQTICSGQQTSISITNPEGISTATFSWTASQANASGAENGSGSSISQILTATTNVPGTVTYSITPSANGCVGPPISRVATVNPRPNASVPAQHYIFSDNTTSISITNPNNVAGTTFGWTATATDVTGMSDGSGPTIHQPLTSVSGGTVNYTITPTANGCFGDPTSTTVNVYPRPIITSTAQRVALDQVTLSTTTGGYDGYTWKNGMNEIGNTATIKTSSPGSYTVTVTKMGATGSSLSYILNDQFAGQNANYIISNAALVKGITDATTITNRTVEDVSQTVQYFDGLGRPIQSVTTQGSPKKKDIVQPVVYDKYGREEKKYLPFVANETSGWFKNSVIDPQTNLYQNAAAGFYTSGSGAIANDVPFATAIFEPSPLNRIEKQGSHGSVWQPDGDPYTTTLDHSIKLAYEGNSANEVLRWTYTLPTTTQLFGLVDAGTETAPDYYAPNSLFKRKTKDENLKETFEYTDKLGRVILKSVEGPNGQWARTYYLYDDFGNLVVVIPPAATALLATEYMNQSSSTAKETFLKRWAFRYRYDERQRMIIKQVPGAEAVFLVYDEHNRLVMMQDGEQRKASPKQWTFTKYDVLNRPVLTGIYHDVAGVDQLGMKDAVIDFYAESVQPPRKPYEEFKTAGAIVHGYTNQSFPDVSNEADYLTVTYYDNHDFVIPYAAGNYNYLSKELEEQPANHYPPVRGQVTGTKLKILGTPNFLWTVNYYDDKYRVIQTLKQNHKGGIDVSTSTYDFSGNAIKTKSSHYNSSAFVLATVNSNDYDHGGRLMKIFHSIDQNPSWANVSGLTIAGDVITKAAMSNSWNAGAFSSNGLPANGDGWVEFQVDQTNKAILVGFSESDQGINSTIQFAAHPDLDGTYYARAGGAYHGPFGSYSAGDLFRVERKNGRILFKRNGEVYYTTEGGSGALFVDMAIHGEGGAIRNVHLNCSGKVQIVQNTYNELGQLIDKTIVGPRNNYLQSVDYRYNIRGWMTSINNAQLAEDPLTNNDSNDLFGMDLLYNTLDPTLGNDDQFNGNISAVKWKTAIHGSAPLEDRKSYGFSYDAMNRLTSATYGAYKPTGDWTSEANAYNEALTYDLNGNIQTLQRTRAKAGTSPFSIIPETIDQLDYDYAKGNQLSEVKDNSGIIKGFKDGATDVNEYSYDDNGNLIKDLNKGIDTIRYNHLNLPALVRFSNGNTIQYTYDAVGNKLKQSVTENSTVKVTDYVQSIVYERDTLRFFSIPEGRVIHRNEKFEYEFILKDHLGNTRVLFGNPFETVNLITSWDGTTTTGFPGNQNVSIASVTQNDESYIECVTNVATSTPGVYPISGTYFTVAPGEKYSFKVKGYGNGADARLYIWSNGGNLVWPGTALPEGFGQEGWVSEDITIPVGVTQIKVGVLMNNPSIGSSFYLNEVGLYKHKDDDHFAGFEVSEQENEYNTFSGYDPTKINSSGAYSRTGNSAYMLSGSTQVTNQVIGPAKSIRVYPGDAVYVDVYGKYVTTTGGTTNVGGVIAGALQGAFRLAAGGATDLAYQSIGDLFDGGALIGTAAYPEEDPAPPKAFLNYILFDDDYVPYDFGYDQIDSEGALPGGVDKMSLVAKVRKSGYIYIYLSNENEVTQEVYFDDLSIKHVKGVAMQQNDYYPFGLTFNSYQRENAVSNEYQFGGKELQGELGVGWLDFGARMYDPTIAKWNGVDKMADAYASFSPYNYVLGNPIANTDVNGQWTVTRHHRMTMEALSRVGIGGEQAVLIADYVSVYADHPAQEHLDWNNRFHPSYQLSYRTDISYLKTENSQVTEYRGHGWNWNIWHSMRSPWEKEQFDKNLPGGISDNDAMIRGMQFGWAAVFKSAQLGKLSELKKDSEGMQEFGQGVHALQDAYAHWGRHDVGPSHLYTDRFGNSTRARVITNSATMVHSIMSGDIEGFNKMFDGGMKSLDLRGISGEDLQSLNSKVIESGKTLRYNWHTGNYDVR